MTSSLDEATAMDEARVEEFAGRLFGTFTASMLTIMVDLGHRTGLFEALAQAPGTSHETAERAGLAERYVRECLGALVTGGIVDYDPAIRVYSLPAEHAVCLTGDGSLNVAPMSQITTLLAKNIDGITRSFRDGGGLPYEQFKPDFTEVMDAASRGLLDGQLLHGILPLTGDLPDRLVSGIRVADVGCGTGHAINLLAKAYPASTFVGYDLNADAIDRARTEAAQFGLSNATFAVRDVATLAPAEPFGAVFAFDSIHDQVDPAGVLARVRGALAAGGVFVMFDIKASSHLENNVDNPFAPWLYGVSTLHCLTVSLAHGGAGLGTVWGQELARQMLAEAGFVDIEVHDVPDDPFNSLYVAHTSPH